MKANVITLEDNKEYVIIDTVVIENNNYLVLASNDDNDEIVIRKVVIKDNKEVLVRLEDEIEFDNVLQEFYKKYRKGESNE